MPVIDDIRESQKNIKDKSLKYKISYYVDYYKVPAIVIILVAIMAVSLIKSIINAKDMAFQAVFLNSYDTPAVEPFAEKLGVDLNKFDVLFEGSYFINPDPEVYDENSYLNSQKLMAIIAASSLDTMLGDPTSMEAYFNSEIFGDLRDYFTEDELAQLGDKVIYHEPIDPSTGEVTGEAYPLAIEVGDSKVLSDVPCYFTESVYFSVIVNTKHPEEVKAFYNYLYE